MQADEVLFVESHTLTKGELNLIAQWLRCDRRENRIIFTRFVFPFSNGKCISITKKRSREKGECCNQNVVIKKGPLIDGNYKGYPLTRCPYHDH